MLNTSSGVGPVQPVTLPANQPAGRFYAGGPAITAFRGGEGEPVHGPEDWVASTTTVRGHDSLGLTVLADGMPLADAIAAAPLAWLGPQHLAAFGVDTKLLVKLLDAGQRLPVHAHPSAAFAHEHLGAAHGKAEAWYMLSAGDVFLGLTRDVAPSELAALVARQDVEGMLALMHRVSVDAGQAVYVPPGLLHAIGAGILLVEVQEPEDLSILLEWRDFDIDGSVHGHLGLGFDTALQAVETRARTVDEIAALVSPVDATSLLPSEAAGYFRLERLQGQSTVEAGFAVLVVIAGSVRLVPVHGEPMMLPRGSTTVIPYASGGFTLDGDGAVLVARPPVPRAG